MRSSILIIFLLASISGFTQNKDKCGQLPYAVVDEKASLSTDMDKIIEETHPVSFADKKEHKGTFKIVVDCQNEVKSVVYSDGNYTKQEEVWMFSQLKNATWKAGKIDGKVVTSTIFITVKTQNLKSEITLK